jgi:hypothetical protein
MERNWVVEIRWWMPRIEVAGDIRLRRLSYTADDDDDYDDDDDDDDYSILSTRQWTKSSNPVI